MKIISFGIIGGLLFVAMPLRVMALATVESRTGEPNVRALHTSSSVSGSTDERAARLTLKQVETLQQEVSELRGLVETQAHEIQQLKKSQQDLYLDLDKRLNTKLGATTTEGPLSVPEDAPLKAPEKIAGKPVEKIATEKAAVEAAEVSASTLTLAPASAEVIADKDPYQFAYQLVQTKRYPEAIVAFQSYITRFPDGVDAANAHYWLGELYMVEWQSDKARVASLDSAIQSFLNVTSHFPDHQKASDSLLKLGIIEVEKHNFKAAKQYFTDLKTRYPSSTAARIAENRLKQLN